MKFTEWMKLKEFQQASPMGQAASPMGQSAPMGQARPTQMKPIAKKDNTVDNVRSIVMKAKDPQTAQKQISQLYDTQMSASKDAAEIATIAAKKRSTLSALQGLK